MYCKVKSIKPKERSEFLPMFERVRGSKQQDTKKERNPNPSNPIYSVKRGKEKIRLSAAAGKSLLSEGFPCLSSCFFLAPAFNVTGKFNHPWKRLKDKTRSKSVEVKNQGKLEHLVSILERLAWLRKEYAKETWWQYRLWCLN